MIQKLKKYAQSERAELKNGISLPEYIWWWTMRLCMIGMIIFNVFFRDREAMVIFLMCLNFLMTFIIPIIRFVFFKKIFLGNLPYRIQSFIDVFVFSGSFLGHGLDFNGTVPEYDKLMHFISGGLAVFIGYLIIMSLKGGKELSAVIKIFGSGGFSCLVMIIWELFEFFSDFFIPGSENQNWIYEPEDNILFFKIFGRGAENTAQYSVLDTDFDIVAATVGCILCMIILYTFIKFTQKNKNGVADV